MRFNRNLGNVTLHPLPPLGGYLVKDRLINGGINFALKDNDKPLHGEPPLVSYKI